MLSMMTPRPIGMSGPLNHVNRSGQDSASTLARRTQAGNAAVRNASMRKLCKLDQAPHEGPRTGLSPEQVRLPVADQLLDRLAIGQLLLEDLSGQVRKLLVAGEAETDELCHGEVIHARLEVCR